ncbi:MAG: PIG-L family deacetylase [Pseudomonadota bacterium]|nr:PIG-L family deacetylase [Pseudomonadota bacterium]
MATDAGIGTDAAVVANDAAVAEERWLKMLSERPEWTPRDGPLVVVSPHPDDEVLAAGGLIHSWAGAGHPVTIVSVTDGEAAFPTWKGLDLVRREELKGALRKLCLTHVSVLRVGLPDGRVSRHINRLRNALLTLVEPGITLVAPYERNGHPDHEAIGQVCGGLAQSHGTALARYPLGTWQHTAPNFLKNLRWRRFSLSLEARRAKARAVQCFASQLQPPRAPPAMPWHVLPHFERHYEPFIV